MDTNLDLDADYNKEDDYLDVPVSWKSLIG
jgi:hypothetical protein